MLDKQRLEYNLELGKPKIEPVIENNSTDFGLCWEVGQCNLRYVRDITQGPIRWV